MAVGYHPRVMLHPLLRLLPPRLVARLGVLCILGALGLEVQAFAAAHAHDGHGAPVVESDAGALHGDCEPAAGGHPLGPSVDACCHPVACPVGAEPLQACPMAVARVASAGLGAGQDAGTPPGLAPAPPLRPPR